MHSSFFDLPRLFLLIAAGCLCAGHAEQHVPQLSVSAPPAIGASIGQRDPGAPADAIIDYTAKNGIDLIVMSTHGRSGVTRFALGSVTDKVVRTVAAPVLVVSPAECKVRI